MLNTQNHIFYRSTVRVSMSTFQKGLTVAPISKSKQ